MPPSWILPVNYGTALYFHKKWRGYTSFMGTNLYMLVELIKPTPVLVILPRYRRHNSIFTKYLENDPVMRTKSPLTRLSLCISMT
jgi:hypothetical protein